MSKRLLNKDDNEDYQDKGDPLPANLQYGPLEERRCQDVLFCLLFTLFWTGLIIIAGVAVNNGDPKRLASPFDSSGNQCGYDAAEDYPYMFFSAQNLVISQKTYACVKSCPNCETQTLNCLVNESVQNCNLLIPYDSHTCNIISNSKGVCVPTSTSLSDSLKSKINIGSVEQWMSDIKVTWPVTLGVTFIAFGLSFIFLLLMRACAGFVTWAMIVGYFTVLITLGILCLYKSYNNNFDQVPPAFQNQQLLEAFGYIILITAGISLLLFICFFNKIRKAIAIMKAASDFTRDLWQAFVIPVIMFILIAAFFSFWIVISLYIFSSGEVVYSNTSPFGSVDWNTGVKRCLVYYLFGLFWNVELLVGMSQLIIASCAGLWYFSHRSSDNLSNPVSKSLFRAFTYHIGSVCLGSMILSIVMLVKFFVELLYKEMKKNARGNAAANCCVRCCVCCLNCFESFIRFVNTNAYIMIGLTGNSFCGSAKQAFFLFLRNAAQFSITQGIGKIFVFIGKFFICIFSTFLGYLMITSISTYSDNIYSAGAPTVLFAIISFCIASVFMNIYGVAADTLLMCLCSDKELNRGRATSCPRSLQEFEEEYMS